jgi:hypothetical protein
MLPRRFLACLLVTVVLLGSACKDSTAPANTFVGEWTLVSFSNHGNVADAFGIMLFRDDGTFHTEGLLSYPGDVTEELAVDGSYRETRDGMVITIGTQSGTWIIARTGTVVRLTLKGPTPTNEIVLRR